MSIRVTSSTDLRKNLSRMMDAMNDDHVPYIITRAGGKPVVMMSLDDYNSYEETKYLLPSPANRQALMNALKQLDKGHGVSKTVEQLETMAGN